MSGKMINGFVNNQGVATTGDKYTSALLSPTNPYMVAVAFKDSFSASKPPIGVATPNGNSNGQTCSVQVANTSLTFQAEEPTPFSFIVTDKGLGYY